MPENPSAAAGGTNPAAGVVAPALLNQLNAANSAYQAAKQNTATAFLTMNEAQSAYQMALQNVTEVPGTPASEVVTPDPDLPDAEGTRTEVSATAATKTGQGAADAAKVAYEAAIAAHTQALTVEAGWLTETARLTAEVQTQQGVTPEERAATAQAFADQTESNRLALEATRTKNAVDAIALEQAQLEQAIANARTPAERIQLENDKIALDKRASEANVAQSEAAAASSRANAGLTAAQTVTENALRPYAVQEAAGKATTAESQGIIDAANAKHADQLAQANADLQQKNVTWQEYQNRLAGIDLEYKTALLNAGMPQIEVDQALATLEATDIANQQLDEGELVTRLTQMRDAIEAGTMTEAQGDIAAEELFTGATQFQRQQQVDSNTQNAINQAAAGGYLVGPNQKTTDPFGLLGSTFESMGMPGQSQQPIETFTPPQWLKDTGQTYTAEARKTFAPGGQFYGDNGLPAWADTSQGLDIGPEEWKQMQGEQVIQKVAGTAEAAEAAPVVAPAGPTASGNVAPTINISFGGGAPEPAAPPAAAAAVPPPVMPSGGGGSVAPPAPPPAAPPLAPLGTKVSAPPTGPEPWGKPTGSQGMQKFGPQPPPLQVPRWMRSAQFAGGR